MKSCDTWLGMCAAIDFNGSRNGWFNGLTLTRSVGPAIRSSARGLIGHDRD